MRIKPCERTDCEHYHEYDSGMPWLKSELLWCMKCEDFDVLALFRADSNYKPKSDGSKFRSQETAGDG